MQIGKFRIEQLSEGFFEVFSDGSFRKMDPSRIENIKDDPSIGKYSSAIGIDPVVISTDEDVQILLDTGLGWGMDFNSRYKNTSNAFTNLEIFGIQPEEIEFVVLSHLHYDHAAGSTYVNKNIKTQPAFPNATYLVQKSEWEYALDEYDHPDPPPGAQYQLDELYKLAAENRLHFLEKESYELIPGIDLIRSGGHTPGHQIVKITDQQEHAYFLGDLIPTEYHLNHYSMKRMDHDPLQSKKFKTHLLKDAFSNGAYLFFYHSLFKKSGKLARDNHKKYVLLDG